MSNALKSVTERFLFIKKDDGFGLVPEPELGFESLLKPFSEAIFNRRVFIAPLSKDNFLATYVGRKRKIYEKAFESLIRKPLTTADSYIQWFMKVEKVQFKESKVTVPRGISPRSPRFNAMLGPFIKRLEKKLYNIINDIFGGTTVFKGLNAIERGNALSKIWNSFDNPVAIPIDAKRFDQHVSRPMLEWEHSIYRMFNDCPQIANLLRMQLDNKFTARMPDGTFTFKTRGKRCSGDMNTSLGNVLIMCGMMHSYLSTRLKKFRIADDGDDCIIFIERRDLSKIKDLYESILKFGFQLEIEPVVDRLEDIEFCQCKPVKIPSGYIMVRDPLKALARDHLSLHTTNFIHYRKWLYQVALCGISLSPGIPILNVYYKKLLSLGIMNDTVELEFCGFTQMSKGMTIADSAPSDESRLSFWRAFNITPERQILLEDYIKKLRVDVNRTNYAQHSELNTLPI